MEPSLLEAAEVGSLVDGGQADDGMQTAEVVGDGVREVKLRFYRAAKVRGLEREYEGLAIDVWTSPDGAAVEGVHGKKLQSLREQ